MCTNLKEIRLKGKYKEKKYNAMIGDTYNMTIYAKCGKCKQCMADKANNWLVRNYYESKAHKEKCFITLTYANNPIFLIKKDGQDFMKRLRTNLKRKYKFKGKIKYFEAGEYGELNNRPHLHYIIYGWEDKKPKFYKYNKKGNPLYISKIIQEAWEKGITTYQPYEQAEIAYLSMYCTEQEQFERAVKIPTEKAQFLLMQYLKFINENKKYKKEKKAIKKIIKEYKNNPLFECDYDRDYTSEISINAIITLNEEIKEAIKKKKKFITIKEFNSWSKSMGWEEFKKQYDNNYVFTEYIGQGEYKTPISWVKKLANKENNYTAIKELKKRQEEGRKITLENTVEEINNINKLRENKKNVEEMIIYNDKKLKIEEF